MTDITNAAGPKNAGAKPRLSLLSSKQSTRLKPEDSMPDRLNLPATLQDSSHDSDRAAGQVAGILASGHDETGADMSSRDTRLECGPSERRNEARDLRVKGQKLQPSNGSRCDTDQVDTVDKTSVCKEDLIRLITLMRSELESKQIAIASMKLEQLKRLMNPVEISRSALASTYIELQDRLRANDRNKAEARSAADKSCANSSALDAAMPIMRSRISSEKGTTTVNGDQEDLAEDEENLTLLNTLLELLDRHPLLALPRDSIYCLDYTCNELSTKNYLNLKIQHLEHLIEQHRRFRYFIGERLKQSEQRYLELTLKLESEKNLNVERENSSYRNEGKALLLKHIDQVKEALEKEKASKHAIVMTLLNELLDERERNEKLARRVSELEGSLREGNNSKPAQVKHQLSSPTASQQTACKPRVPAKPAQLLDRQRSQTNNR